MYNDYLPSPGMYAKTLQIRVSPVGTCSICLNVFTYIFFLFIIIITFYDNCFSLLLLRFFRGVGGGLLPCVNAYFAINSALRLCIIHSPLSLLNTSINLCTR